jgi:hypothetical protein
VSTTPPSTPSPASPRHSTFEFAIDIHPRQCTPKLLSGHAQGRNAIASYETDTATILLAAG